MSMTVSIHQPNFIPWLGYFYKISRSDVFVLLDDVQYTKNSFINRNKLKTANGPAWLTLPVTVKSLSQCINEVRYFELAKNADKAKKTVLGTYRKAPHFAEYYDGFCGCLDFPSDVVSEFNANLLRWVMDCFGITTRVEVSSIMEGVEGTGTDRLVSICKAFGATAYLSGKGGANYQDEELYKANGIELVYTDFKHPQYPQLYGEFLPGMACIDAIFNCGPDAKGFFSKP